ncbi:MAG: hypothetical protein U0792_01745 [Gemmataceae bacterium]
MLRPGVQVHHWLVTKQARTYGSVPESDLLGVAHNYPIPPDTEFPKSRRPLVMFLRVFSQRAGLVDFLIQIHWQMGTGEWKRTTLFSDPNRPFVFPPDREILYADWIRLPYATLQGYGLYAVTIYFRRIEADDEEGQPEADQPDTWEESQVDVTPFEVEPMPWDPEETGWVFGAVDYFYVVNL